MIINVPASVGMSHYYPSGRPVIQSKMLDGRLVIDLLPGDFTSLLTGQHGAAWAAANSGAGGAMEELGRFNMQPRSF
ncbi:hypothetical protein AAFG13_06105 [Bradyrhizobium sp. B124]|uniref:hypothetical protein n=1 Tax=Bradyrhizobium sp. B124 TaxID=3140245 RepID=UPI0031835DC8